MEIQPIGEPIRVVAEFLGGRAEPLRFSWSGRTYDIAAVNGHCIAGGMEMLAGTDLRVAAEHASFGLGEVRWGLVPAGGSHIRFPRQLPWAMVMELLLTGEPRDAEWARNAGFVNTVVPNDELISTAERMAQNIADNGEEAIRIMRKLGEMALDEKFADLVAEGRKLRNSMQTGDMADRQAAFVKRKRD